jgi:hypothetical protein
VVHERERLLDLGQEAARVLARDVMCSNSSSKSCSLAALELAR